MKDKASNIVEQATNLFIRKGLQPVSMNDISLYSGISKKTLYENFLSKEQLVNTAVQQIISKISKFIRLCAGISPNAITEMENIACYVLDLPEMLTPALMRDLKKYYPGVYEQLRIFRTNSIIPFMQTCLQRGIEENIFRPGIDKTNIVWLYCWQLQNALEGGNSLPDTKKLIDGINDLLLHGILNAKGFKLLSMKTQKINMKQDS